jgi:hypothetical protein
MTSFLGIKFSHAPILAIIIFIIIVLMQVINKFLFIDKGKDNIAVEAKRKYKEAGYLAPFFQAGAIDMYTDNEYTSARIINIVVYYMLILTGLILTESILGRYTMLLLLLVGVGVEFVSFAMLKMTCFPYGQFTSTVGDLFCCGVNIQWYYAGVIASILLNYHFLAKKKITTALFMLMYFVIGIALSLYQTYYIYNVPIMKEIAWCATGTMSIAPYLIGGAFTFGSLNLLFTKF